MSDVTDAVGKVAEKVVEETGKNAGSPQWTLNVLVLVVVSFILLGFGAGPIVWFVYVGKPSAEAQNEAVRASTEAIRSNAESNRKMGDAVSRISTSVEEINTHFRRSAEKMDDAVGELKTIERSQDAALRKITEHLDKT